ncbi:MAG: hypothetical protein ACQES0_10945 [Bacteroidota bacterium]
MKKGRASQLKINYRTTHPRLQVGGWVCELFCPVRENMSASPAQERSPGVNAIVPDNFS